MQKIHILLIDMEYERDELNEPINVDTILDSFDEFVLENAEIDVWYRTLGDLRERDPASYDLVLISSKVSSGTAMEQLIVRHHAVPTIVGGMLATYAYESILRKYPELILSLGECECNLNLLVGMFIRCRSFGQIKRELKSSSCTGVAFVDSGGDISVIPIRAFDLSIVTEPLSHRSLPHVIRNSGLVRIEGSRGCPWNHCTFCSVAWKYGGAPWRAFPIDRTVKEVVKLSKAGATCVYFTDEDFVGRSDYFIQLFSSISELMARGVIDPALCIWGSTSVYTLSHFRRQEFAQFIELSQKCNIQVLFLGIESGCSAQLKRFNKGVSKEDNLSILRALHDNGILVDAGFILFDAETTLAEVLENIEFCKSSGLDRSLSRLSKTLRAIPHTSIYRSYEKKGLLLGQPDISELTQAFRFTDSKVQALHDCLVEIDAHILKKANALQAELRMTGSYESDSISSELSKCRQISFRFIEEFVKLFLDAPLDRGRIESMLAEYCGYLSYQKGK